MEQVIKMAVSEYARTGITHIPRWAMYEAHDAQRLGKNAWRDLSEHIQDHGGDPAKARLLETEGEFVLINQSNAKSLSNYT